MSAPYMPLYCGDYLGDTRHLTTEQHGAYLLLMMCMWRAGGELPNDEKALSRMTGCTASRWAKIGAEVIAFFDVEGDIITSKRLKFELEKTQKKSIIRSQAGKRGGTAKSRKTKKTGQANANDLPEQNPTILQNHSQIESSLDKSKHTLSGECEAKEKTFEDFRAKYPNPDGLVAAERDWEAALDGGATAEEILAGLERWLAKWRRDNTDARWKPKACNWLSDRKWLDPIDGGVAIAPIARHWPETHACAAIRRSVVAERDEGFARSYLDQCQFDGGSKTISTVTNYAADMLGKLKCLGTYTIRPVQRDAA